MCEYKIHIKQINDYKKFCKFRYEMIYLQSCV